MIRRSFLKSVVGAAIAVVGGFYGWRPPVDETILVNIPLKRMQGSIAVPPDIRPLHIETSWGSRVFPARPITEDDINRVMDGIADIDPLTLMKRPLRKWLEAQDG